MTQPLIPKFKLFILFSFFSFSLNAETITLDDIPPNTSTLTINSGDTLILTHQIEQININNFGEVRATGVHIRSIFNNHGNLFAYGNFSIAQGPDSGSDYKIINHASGNMTKVGGYMDFYSINSIFENAGQFSTIHDLGDSSNASSDVFTYGLKGIIKNTGIFLIDLPQSLNACMQSFENGLIHNTGNFEISQGTNCNFRGFNGADLRFTQDSGHLIVDGYFSATPVYIKGGIISGNGTIEGMSYQLFNKVSLSPGSPIGTLTLTPHNQHGMDYMVCSQCSIDIELASPSNSDHLHVNGQLYLHKWNLNVLLRNGYIPHLGDSFDILSATNGIEIIGEILEHSLPRLPNGLAWDIQNNGSTITLSVI